MTGTKRLLLIWISTIVGLAAIIVLLHAIRVLPLSPAPPYQDGDKRWVTPTNPWTW